MATKICFVAFFLISQAALARSEVTELTTTLVGKLTTTLVGNEECGPGGFRWTVFWTGPDPKYCSTNCRIQCETNCAGFGIGNLKCTMVVNPARLQCDCCCKRPLSPPPPPPPPSPPPPSPPPPPPSPPPPSPPPPPPSPPPPSPPPSPPTPPINICTAGEAFLPSPVTSCSLCTREYCKTECSEIGGLLTRMGCAPSILLCKCCCKIITLPSSTIALGSTLSAAMQ